MSTAAATIPGLYFTAGARPVEPSPLRSDVAGFMGRTRRGTPGKLVRVEGWRAYLREFGGLDAQAIMPYAIRGYFENGGEVAHVVRLCGPDVRTASADWRVADLDLNDVLHRSRPPLSSGLLIASRRARPENGRATQKYTFVTGAKVRSEKRKSISLFMLRMSQSSI